MFCHFTELRVELGERDVKQLEEEGAADDSSGGASTASKKAPSGVRVATIDNYQVRTGSSVGGDLSKSVLLDCFTSRLLHDLSLKLHYSCILFTAGRRV